LAAVFGWGRHCHLDDVRGGTPERGALGGPFGVNLIIIINARSTRLWAPSASGSGRWVPCSLSPGLHIFCLPYDLGFTNATFYVSLPAGVRWEPRPRG